LDISSRTATIVGIAMIVLVVLLVIEVAFSATTGDNNPFTKSEVPAFLNDVHDSETEVIVAGAVGIILDGFVSVIVAAGIYVLFRDRNPLLASIAFGGLIANAVLSLIVDGSNILLTQIAADFVKGGPGNIAAGDPSTLELGRYVGMITLAFGNVAATPLGIALLSLGALLVAGPQGIFNPPRWIGWVAMISGASAELAWLVVAADPFFVFFVINLLSSVILLVSLGIWLIRHGDLQPAPMKA
jgi:hypothetical protein